MGLEGLRSHRRARFLPAESYGQESVLRERDGRDLKGTKIHEGQVAFFSMQNGHGIEVSAMDPRSWFFRLLKILAVPMIRKRS